MSEHTLKLALAIDEMWSLVKALRSQLSKSIYGDLEKRWQRVVDAIEEEK